MKRFITYLYEYDHGNKTKNVGFIRVDIRETIVNIEVCIKNFIREAEEGKIYVLIPKATFTGIELGKINLRAGQYNKKFSFDKNDLADSGNTIHDVVGMAVCFDNNEYLASCWKDECAEEIANGKFSVYKEETDGVCLEKEVIDCKEQVIGEDIKIIQECSLPQGKELKEKKNSLTYKKIELNQIRDLPSSNWHLCNNSFLLHGVVNYGYIFLKKEIDGEKERLWLGVPGYYEKPELFMALLFGFTEFKAVPKTVVDMELNKESKEHNIETNQEPKTGIFGGWFVPLSQ